MNVDTDSTAPAPAATTDHWFKAATQYEEALYVVRDLSRLAKTIAIQHLDELEGAADVYRLDARRGDEIVSLIKASERIVDLVLGGPQ